MTRKPFIVGTAGHIDHGKSTLVEALTGTDPDRLPEEKARGMTIDLGFAHVDIVDPDDANTIFSLGVVDVPGHADFVKNMVAGVGSIDLAVIVVATDDRWMPQTEEHVQILEYLGVTSAVVALTKSDLVSDPSEATENVRQQLASTRFADAEIVPVSAIGGDGLDELKAVIAKILKQTPPPTDIGKPRLHIDRAFSPRGVGTVVTGTLSDGSFNKGDSAKVQPLGERTTIRNLQSHNTNLEQVQPGMRTAINLSDVGVGKQDRKGIHRGDVVTLSHFDQTSRQMDVLVERSSREVPGQPAMTKPIKQGQRVRVHLGGASHPARVNFHGTRNLMPGESCLAQLRFDDPVFAFYGDRFVIRDWPKSCSLAGGVILDAHAQAQRFRSEAQQRFLQARAEAPNDLHIAVTTLLGRDHAVSKEGLLRQSRFADDAIAAEVAKLGEGGTLEDAGAWLVDREWWSTVLTHASDLIGAYHKDHADLAGMPLRDLRPAMETYVPYPGLVDAALTALETSGDYERVGSAIKHKQHRPSLPKELKVAGDRILKDLAANPLEPPNPKELAPSDSDYKALRFLIEIGEVLDLGDKCALLTSSYENAKSTVIDYLKANQKATVSEMRQTLGTTRRVLMPILDRLDKEGVTIRVDDYRVLSRSWLRKQGLA